MKKQLLIGLGCLSGIALSDMQAFAQAIKGPSTAQTPWVTPTSTGTKITSIVTTGDVISGYKMVGLPDGAGAYDNGNGTFTFLVNHEMGNTEGAVHAHGQRGAFISKWIINKSDFSVVSGADLIQKVFLWSTTTSSYTAYNAAFPSASAAFARFCSGDLPPVSAFYNSKTGKGTQARIMMNGEESGSEGRGMAHIATGPEAGNSYELPYLGKFSWENTMASPFESDSTIVVGTDDATPGQVYVYVGAKQTTGNEIERAGLHGGTLYGIAVTGLVTESSSSVPAANTAFTLKSLGKVQNLTGSNLNTNSNNAGVTNFLRPEDGAWDPANPNDFYFVTTNAFNSPSRLWRVRFTNIANPSLGGTITAVLDGTEGQQMMDNIGIDNYGHILIQEDCGNQSRLGKTWQYDIATDVLIEVAAHDATRFVTGGANYLTQDEEASGAIDVQEILGPGMWLGVDQGHYSIAGDEVQGGQLFAQYNPDSYNSNPEVDVTGNGTSIVDGDATPAVADNTDFGSTNKSVAKTRTYKIKNAGPGKLTIKEIKVSGAQAAEFTVTSPLVFPVTVNANDSTSVTVQFLPLAAGVRNAKIEIVNNDFTEKAYDFNVTGTSTVPKIAVQGNSNDINDGDLTAGAANNTDFGSLQLNSSVNKTFDIKNNGTGPLTITNITMTGTNASEFTLVSAPTYPLVLAPAASQSITLKFTPTAVGTRTAMVNITNDDVDHVAFKYAVEGMGIDNTSVNAVSVSSFAKLYPNPTGDMATVAMSLSKQERIVISVLDIQGKEVMAAIANTYKAGEHKVALNTSNLNNGVYFVQIASEKETSKIKMVVMH
jgi:hypothetical protein